MSVSGVKKYNREHVHEEEVFSIVLNVYFLSVCFVTMIQFPCIFSEIIIDINILKWTPTKDDI
jgi:hypothetical protein